MELPVAGLEPVEVLEAIPGEIDAGVPVLIPRSERHAVADSVRLIKLGAYHFTSGLLKHGELAGHLEMAAEKRRLRKSAFAGAAPEGEPWKRFLIGESRKRCAKSSRSSHGGRSQALDGSGGGRDRYWQGSRGARFAPGQPPRPTADGGRQL